MRPLGREAGQQGGESPRWGYSGLVSSGGLLWASEF